MTTIFMDIKLSGNVLKNVGHIQYQNRKDHCLNEVF